MFKNQILGGDANLKTIVFFVLSLPLVLMFGGAGFAKMINAGDMATMIAAFSLILANGDYGMTTHVIVIGILCLLVAWGSRRPLVEFANREL